MRRRFLSELGHELWRDHRDGCLDSKRHDDQVIQVADDGDEVRDQVDRAERISGYETSRHLCVPRCSTVVSCKPKCDDIPLEPFCPKLELRDPVQLSPRRAASILAMSILRIVIIASNTRLATALSGSVIPSISCLGVICQE